MKTVKTVTGGTPAAVALRLGLSGAESQEWQVQQALLKSLRLAVVARGLTHGWLAERAGTSRARVCTILNGHMYNVSIGMLVRLLGAAGCRVCVSVSRMD